MFVLSKQDNAMFRVIATLVSFALVLWGYGAHVQSAQAANITDVYDLLSTSATSTVSNHTIEFVSPTGVANGETITISFDPIGSNFTGVAGIDTNDVDILVNEVAEDIEGGDWTVGGAGDVLTLTNVVGSIAPGATTTILIGLHATNEGVPDEQITNPGTQGSYDIDITAGSVDTGSTEIAIVDTVYVTAQVDTNFEFTVIGEAAAGTAINGTTTTGTTSATQLPFGLLAQGAIETLSQELTVATNAINGFVVTAEVDQQLLSSTGADIDAFDDGAFLAPKTWENPGNGTPNIADEDTWGHWGWTSEDTDTTRTAGFEFGANEWEGASTSPAVVFSHNGPADATTAGIGSTNVGFQIEITALQEAADDYRAQLTYIATPTF